MGRKTHNKDKERSDLQRARAEIRTLKRQLARERKLNNQLMEEKLNTQVVLELVDIQRKEDRILHDSRKQEELREKWKCFKCPDGVLKLQIFNRLDGAFYYRRCACGHKTKMKKHHKGVEGYADI